MTLKLVFAGICGLVIGGLLGVAVLIVAYLILIK